MMNTGYYEVVVPPSEKKSACAASAFDRVIKGAEKLTAQLSLIESTTRYRRELYYAGHVMRLYESKVRRVIDGVDAASRLSLTEALALFRNPESFQLLDRESQLDLRAYVVAKREYEVLRARSIDADK